MWRTRDAERILVELHQQGVNAWPAIDVPLSRFSAHVEAVSPADLSLDALAKLSGEGLTLCVACLEQQPAAMGIFESVYLAPLARVLAKLDGGAEVADDVLQRLRAQFFAPANGRSSFFAYSGGGALAVWLKVVAVREAQKLRRGAVQTHTVNDDTLSVMPTPEADPELRFMKLQHRAHFKVCFQEALAALGKRERSVLRMSLVEGLSIDDIGRVYDVHRATAARWLTSAREQLVSDCRAKLAERLKVSEAELDELMGSAQSNLSISLGQLSVRGAAK
jgi:RNA polymerase sigma-70 factor (ECF subfamily)